MMHPLLGNRSYLNIYFAAWLVLAAAQAVILVFTQELAWGLALLDGLTFNTMYAALGVSYWFMVKALAGDNVSFLRTVENHGFAALATSLLWIGAGYVILTHVFSPGREYVAFLKATLVWRGLIGILNYFITISLYHLYILSVRLRQRAVKEAELKTLVKEAELRSLRFQVNPHFIFNSLNSVNSLTLTNPEKAGEMTVKLGNFLRYTLAKGDQKTSLLREELDSMRLYLDIEKVRFGDKIEYDERCPESCRSMKIPGMILQPLFENAIKHGVYESLTPVKIRFDCQRDGDFLKMRLQNSLDDENIQRTGAGIGLKNVRDRLERMYGMKNLFAIEKTDGYFTVRLFIPVKET